MCQIVWPLPLSLCCDCPPTIVYFPTHCNFSEAGDRAWGQSSPTMQVLSKCKGWNRMWLVTPRPGFGPRVPQGAKNILPLGPQAIEVLLGSGPRKWTLRGESAVRPGLVASGMDSKSEKNA